MRRQLSPNCGPRRDGLTPIIIVIHYTAMRSAQAALERLCDPQAQVSAHYLISAQGAVTQMVEEKDRAWHAGAGEWRGMTDINSRSIGVELDNRGTHPFSEPLMTSLEIVLSGIMARWRIKPDSVIGHSDMAPGRKTDPGPHFDWARLARRGLAAQGRARPSDATKDAAALGGEAAFLNVAREAGFTAPADFETLLHSVRLRHAPWRRGALQAADFTL
jgi:N-acetylmuramoyl-L-alanine amidase